MENIQFPTIPQLINSLVLAIRNNHGAATNQEIKEFVITSLSLSPEQVSIVHEGNRTKLDYRLAWARTKAKEQGLILKDGPGKWRTV
jgi:restriction system protein